MPRADEVRERRNNRILELRAQGFTLDQIGREFGITREAVRQVVARMNGPSADFVRKHRRRPVTSESTSQKRRVRAFVEEHPGCSLEDLSHGTNIDIKYLHTLIPNDLRPFVVVERKNLDSQQAQADALNALRQAATYDWPLTRVRFDELVRQGEISGLSSVRIMQIFGTWSNACLQAGVESPAPVRDNYQSRWTDQDLIGFVGDYLRSAGASGSHGDFDRWASERIDAPSGQTLRNRLGTWNEAKRKALEVMKQEAGSLGILGPEARLFDAHLSSMMDENARRSIWSSARAILGYGPVAVGKASSTCLALGYVQSGKTTSITALVASAADAGYKIVIALLGSTNLLLDQNRKRVEDALGIGQRHDYVWVSEPNPSGVAGAKAIKTHISRDRVIFIPVLKHAGRIRALVHALSGSRNVPTLIIDDEADQISLNTAGQVAESRTYQAIRTLREAVPNHLYVQYTATPYAPLLLEAEDLLHPDAVEFLQPGPGYVGGRQFFIDHAERVVRDVPALEEQGTKSPPLELPSSLLRALASFCAGSVLLIADEAGTPPVSMLVHSTARNDVQERYHFLIGRQLNAWQKATKEPVTEIPTLIQEERARLRDGGVKDIANEQFLDGLRKVLQEAHLWLVNSTSALNRIDWTISPIHILIGGNKLDRGFTVRGLTVTYMNRPASVQVDTLEQRARAFGYRGDELPYCQFFASKRTINSLRNIVFTEYDLRARLQDHVDSGGSVQSWAREVGLLLPTDMKPTRDAVVKALSETPAGWHSIRKPALDSSSVNGNIEVIERLGLFAAPLVSYGRLAFKTLELPLQQVIEQLMSPWRGDSYSPSWQREQIIDQLQRLEPHISSAKILLMDEQGSPRVRRWDTEVGFVNLFQGRDLNYGNTNDAYPGDRQTPNLELNPEQVAVQVHRVVRRGDENDKALLTLAVHLSTQKIVRKIDG